MDEIAAGRYRTGDFNVREISRDGSKHFSNGSDTRGIGHCTIPTPRHAIASDNVPFQSYRGM